MEMKVALPSPPLEFNFKNHNNGSSTSNCSSPTYISAPSSPQRHNFFFYSAPTSPRSSSFFSNELDHVPLLSSAVPFQWEDKPGVPKYNTRSHSESVHHPEDDDFEFDFSGQLDVPSLCADDLFDGGKIRPLKPPPRLQVSTTSTTTPTDSPKSPRSPVSKFRQVFSPRQRKDDDCDPFEAALQHTSKSETHKFHHHQRGRSPDKVRNSRPNSKKGISRSLSPLRVSEFALHQQELINQEAVKAGANSTDKSSSSPRPPKKWNLKDLLLFRSASEGRATTGKDPLRKYFAMVKKGDQNRHSSFRSTTSTEEGSVSRRRSTAQEMHYTANRAASEELRKKTFLPYRHGLLGCLGFTSPAIGDFAIPRGLGSSFHYSR